MSDLKFVVLIFASCATMFIFGVWSAHDSAHVLVESQWHCTGSTFTGETPNQVEKCAQYTLKEE